MAAFVGVLGTPTIQRCQRNSKPVRGISVACALGAADTDVFTGDGMPTIKDFNRRISHHGRRREFDAAEKVKGMIEAAEVLETGIRRNVYTFNAWLDACVRCGRMELTDEALREMISIGVPPNIVSFNTLLKGYVTGSKRDLDRALALLKEMRRMKVEPDIRSYNTVLNACAVASEMKKAQEIFAEMIQTNIEPDDFTMTTLAKGWMALKNVEELDRVLLLKLKMESRNSTQKPRSATAYYTIAHGYVQSARPRKAIALIQALLPGHEEDGFQMADENVFAILRDFNIAPDVNTFNVLLKALRESGARSEVALEVLDEMKRYRVKPDEITYLALVDLLSINGDMKVAENVICTLQASDIAVTASTYNALIKGYARCELEGSLGKVFAIYDAMREGREGYPRPDHVTSARVVDALARAGDIHLAIKVLNEAEDSKELSERPRREGYNALIKAYRTALLRSLTAANVEERQSFEEADEDVVTVTHQQEQYFLAARRLLNRMSGFHDKRMHPDVVTFNTLIDISAELGDVGAAERLYHDMLESDVLPDVTTFNTLIKACNRARVGLMAALKWMKEMSAFGVKPDQFTYSGLLSASAESKDVPNALEYFQKTLIAKQNELTKNRESGEPPVQLAVHPSAYVSLMKAFSNLGVRGSPMLAKLREELEERGFEMGVSGYTAIANCFAQQGDIESVDATFREMRQKVKNVPETLNRRQRSIRLKAFCKSGQLDSGMAILMSEREPDVAMFNTMLAHSCAANHMNHVVAILRRMEALGVEPDVRTGASVKEMMRVVAQLLKGFDKRFSLLVQEAIRAQQEAEDISPGPAQSSSM